jgi:hypothetical protein
MSTRLRALALFVACCTASVSAIAQELTVPPLPPIESELFEKTPEVDYERQDVGWVSEALPRENNFLDNRPESRFYSTSDLIVFDTDWGPTDGEDTFSATRNELGWENEDGVGMRAQYLMMEPSWNVMHGPSGTEIVNPDPGDIFNYGPYYAGSVLLRREVDNLNFDLYKRMELGESEVQLGVGVTTVRSIEELQQIFDTGSPGGSYSYINTSQSLKGVGVGLSGRLRRPLVVQDTWEVAFLLGGRTSYVPMDVEQQNQLVAFHGEHNMKLHEGRIGMEFLKRFETMLLTVSCQYEKQHWDNDTTDVRSFDGVGVSVGVAW